MAKTKSRPHWHWISYATSDYDVDTGEGEFLGVAIVDAPSPIAAEVLARQKGISPALAWALPAPLNFCSERVQTMPPQYTNRLLGEVEAVLAAALIGLKIDDPSKYIPDSEGIKSCHLVPIPQAREEHFWALPLCERIVKIMLRGSLRIRGSVQMIIVSFVKACRSTYRRSIAIVC